MAGRIEATEESFNQLLGAIYDVPLAPDRWHDVLARLREMFNVGSAALVVHNADRSRVDGLVAGVDHEGHQHQLRTIYRENNIFHANKKQWFQGQVAPSSALVPDPILHRSRMYQEYWKPRDLSHGVRMTVSIDEAGVHHALNLLRHRRGKPVEPSDIALGRLLMPHLQRAVALEKRFHEAHLLQSAAFAVLDALRDPVLLLGRDARVLRANAAADALLTAADGIRCRDGSLEAASKAATDQLHGLIARASGAGGKPVQADVMRLPRHSGAPPLALVAMPFRADTDRPLLGGPAVLVFITDPAGASPPPRRQMMKLYGLTGAEAALAADLLVGLEPREIAERRGRSFNTVRTQLAGLMAKTNVNRQTDLVRLLARMPSDRDWR